LEWKARSEERARTWNGKPDPKGNAKKNEELKMKNEELISLNAFVKTLPTDRQALCDFVVKNLF